MALRNLRGWAGRWILGVGACVGIALAVDGWIGTPEAPHTFGATPAYAAAGTDLFAPIAVVLRDPRCMNCHPRDERPRQGLDRHIHQQNVVRGEDDMGFVNMRCNACHRDENNRATGVPGAPSWRLAPLSMGWQGLGDADLCSALKDEKRNGGRTIAALLTHMTSDKQVLWGWDPGSHRAPVSVPHATFVAQLKEWAKAGALCPVQ